MLPSSQAFRHFAELDPWNIILLDIGSHSVFKFENLTAGKLREHAARGRGLSHEDLLKQWISSDMCLLFRQRSILTCRMRLTPALWKGGHTHEINLSANVRTRPRARSMGLTYTMQGIPLSLEYGAPALSVLLWSGEKRSLESDFLQQSTCFVFSTHTHAAPSPPRNDHGLREEPVIQVPKQQTLPPHTTQTSRNNTN